MKLAWSLLLVLLGSLGLSAYFGFHTVYGKHGLEARRQLEARRAYVQQRLKTLKTVSSELRREIAGLDPGAPDADLVEEIAKGQLGFAFPDETILIVKRD